MSDIPQVAHWLVIDFEATCCDQGSVPRQEMEIIEFGAVIIARDTLQQVDEFQSFVRPQRHPQLSRFCTELTSITQQQVDSAPTFSEMLPLFRQWLQQWPHHAFGSWGDYDYKQLQQDCALHREHWPIAGPHCNLKRLFALRQGLSKAPGLGQAVRMAGLAFAGTHHRGIDDARNIGRLMPYIIGHQRLPR